MKYYKITCATPFVGEENDYYVVVANSKNLKIVIDECIYENGLEWYDDDMLELYGFTDEEYFAECHLVDLHEITEEEYYEACPWEREEE